MVAVICLNTNRQTVMTVYGVISLLPEGYEVYFPDEPAIMPFFKYKVSKKVDKKLENFVLVNGVAVNTGHGWQPFTLYESRGKFYGDVLSGDYLNEAAKEGYLVPSTYPLINLADMLNQAKLVQIFDEDYALYIDLEDMLPEVASGLGSILRDLCQMPLVLRLADRAYIYAVGFTMLRIEKLLPRDDYGHFCYEGEFDGFCGLIQLDRRAYGIED